MHKLKNSELENFKGLISNAFAQDPLFISIADDVEKRKRVSFILFKLMLELSDGEMEMYTPTEKREGIAIWENTDKKKTRKGNVGQLMKEAYQEIGFWGMIKMTWNTYKLVKNTSQLSEQSNYKLNILAVDPKYKGQGFASKLVKPMLKKFDQEELVCLLDTNNPNNVSMYKHLGFSLKKTTKVNNFLKGFYMLRMPKLAH